jgi:ribose 5-phosphate isomerase B
MIYLGADHAGYELKETIKKHLDNRRFSYIDVGAFELQESDDYPDFGSLVAKKVSISNKDRGILICGAGNGMAIVANKFKGVRATLAWNEYTAEKSVTDDHSNILVLPARVISSKQAILVLDSWLASKPSKDKRHVRRIEKISNFEK